jgi:hypothetical protein
MKMSFVQNRSQMLDKAFCFIVVLWGERFRNFFTNFCLPSLLSPGNIPSLATNPRSKFIVATRPEDWRLLNDNPTFQDLKRFVEPVFVEIPEQPDGKTGAEHMGIGHKRACAIAFKEKGLAVVLTPDCMLSDGSISRLQSLAHEGFEVVLTAALRFGEEPFFKILAAQGLLPSKRNDENSSSVLTITGRQMAHAAVSAFHPETLSYEWDSPYLVGNAPAAWWSVAGEDGVVLHCLSWAPLLLDYSVVREHDTSMLDDWTIDGDYVFKNTKSDAKVYVVQDSDEIFLASWSKMEENASVFRVIPFLKTPIGRHIQRLMRGAEFRKSFYFTPTFDPLKRRIFFLPVRWHARALNERWTVTEKKATFILRQWLGTPLNGIIVPSNLSLTARPRLALAGAVNWAVRLFVFLQVKEALLGDKRARRRLSWFIRRKIFTLLGLTFNEPPPRSS